jgi:hypothetical protein
MKARIRKTPRVPEGKAFLKLVAAVEDANATKTDKLLPKMGKKAPSCYREVGTVLSLLGRMASCWWVCRGGDHLIEYMCGRAASCGRASVRLIRMGFYDEALALIRTIAEIANLLALFQLEPSSLSDWKDLPEQQRKQQFSPARVRIRLERIAQGAYVDEIDYRVLSGRSTHANPSTRPQSYNVFNISSAGPLLQQEGLVICLNELAASLVLTMLFGTQLFAYKRPLTLRLLRAGRKLAEHVGGARLSELADYHQRVREKLAAQSRERSEEGQRR